MSNTHFATIQLLGGVIYKFWIKHNLDNENGDFWQVESWRFTNNVGMSLKKYSLVNM